MILNIPYTILGTEAHPKLQFFHEIVECKSNSRDFDDFNRLHKQDYYEFSFFISGKRKIKVEDKIYTFDSGDVFIAYPNEAHGGSAYHCLLNRYRLHIMPDAFDDLPDGKELQNIIFDIKKNFGNKLSLSSDESNEIYHYLSNIDNSIKFGNPKTKNICALADIIKLLTFLENHTLNKRTQKNKILLDILSYIESSYDNISISDIERQFSISHATLWRLFKKELNTSPSEYILDMRLIKAEQLLDKCSDIQEVSDRCGFCDCSYFIKKFKKKYGKTPYRFKKLFDGNKN